MTTKKRIATATHSPNFPTGFGRVNKEISNSLGKKYEVFCIGWQFQGLPFQPKFPYLKSPENYVICPTALGGNYNEFGQKTFPPFFQTFKPDMLLTLADWFVFSRPAHGFSSNWLPNFIAKKGRLLAQKKVEWVWYFPVDSTPICVAFVDILRYCPHPVTMSKYGFKELDAQGFMSMYIPHGVDPTVFYRLPDEERLKIRRNIGMRLGIRNLEDKKIYFWGGRNQIRKFPQLLIEAFGKFAQDKDDVFLLLHTTPVPAEAGYSLGLHIERYNLQGKVGFTNSGSIYMPTDSFLNEIYNAADYYIDTAGGEGFGFFRVEPYWIPAIMPYWTTAPEFMGREPIINISEGFSDHRKDGNKSLTKTKYGFLVPLIDAWSTGVGSDFGVIDRDYFIEAMNYFYYHDSEAKNMGMARKQFIVKEYNWDWIRTMWLDYISSIFDENESEFVYANVPTVGQ